MNDKKAAPKVAITKGMVEAGKAALDAMTAEDVPGTNEVTDDMLVAQVFYNMWRVYWEEVLDVRAKKKAGSPIIKPSQRIIVPFRN